MGSFLARIAGEVEPLRRNGLRRIDASGMSFRGVVFSIPLCCTSPSTAEGGEGDFQLPSTLRRERGEPRTGGVFAQGEISQAAVFSTRSSNTSRPRNPTRPPCGRPPSPRFARRRESSPRHAISAAQPSEIRNSVTPAKAGAHKTRSMRSAPPACAYSMGPGFRRDDVLSFAHGPSLTLPPPPKAGRVARGTRDGWGVCTRGDLSSTVFSTQSSNTSRPRNPTRPPSGVHPPRALRGGGRFRASAGISTHLALALTRLVEKVGAVNLYRRALPRSLPHAAPDSGQPLVRRPRVGGFHRRP